MTNRDVLFACRWASHMRVLLPMDRLLWLLLVLVPILRM